MSLRVQAFEIIRTWLFYSIVQSELHFGRVPWHAVMISGWGLNEQGKKISKRDLDQSQNPDGSGFNRYVPDDVIEKYGADALRLWATKARVGTDLRYNEKDIRAGRKFVVKMWNVGRFIAPHLSGFDAAAPPVPPADRTAVDRWLLGHLGHAINDVTTDMRDYDFMQGHAAASRFFWSIYCDRYIEMIKDRFLFPEEHSDQDRLSAQWTLWESFRAIIGLFAPFAPFITEHMYQEFFRSSETARSLHASAWPVADQQWQSDTSKIETMVGLLDAVRALRHAHRLGNNTRVSKIVVSAPAESGSVVASIAEPLRVAARAAQIELGTAETDSGVEGILLDLVP
jgi:valyl-tRNA synthetase